MHPCRQLDGPLEPFAVWALRQRMPQGPRAVMGTTCMPSWRW